MQSASTMIFMMSVLSIMATLDVIAFIVDSQQKKRAAGRALFLTATVMLVIFFGIEYGKGQSKSAEDLENQHYQVVCQEKTGDSFVAIVQDEVGKMIFVKNDSELPPIFIVSGNGITNKKCISQVMSVVINEPDNPVEDVSYEFQKDGQPLSETQPLTDNPPATQ